METLSDFCKTYITEHVISCLIQRRRVSENQFPDFAIFLFCTSIDNND